MNDADEFPGTIPPDVVSMDLGRLDTLPTDPSEDLSGWAAQCTA